MLPAVSRSGVAVPSGNTVSSRGSICRFGDGQMDPHDRPPCVQVLARFVRNSDQTPISGPEYRVALRDRDALRDDDLGTAIPDEEGRTHFLFALSELSTLDSPGECRPDLYLILQRGDEEIFRSPVFPNVEFLKMDPVSGEPSERTHDLGTFQV